MKSRTPTAEQKTVHMPPTRPATKRRRPRADPLPREVLRSEVARDVGRFLDEGHTITLVPIGASAFDPSHQRNPKPFMEWDE